jgi:beta-N-acetylhexosaminidase
MEALQGDFGSRAAGVVAAGNDAALHCSGVMEEMVAVAAAVPALSERGAERLARAMASVVEQPKGMDFAAAIANRDALLAQA